MDSWRDAMAQAHDVDVKPGLRFFVKLNPESDPIHIQLPGPALAAGVLDPETELIHRANLEWGEPPKRIPSDVGTVELSEDRRSFVFTPGRDPIGVLWVQAEDSLNAAETTMSRGTPLPLQSSPDGMHWGSGLESVRVAAGAVLVPPPGEAARMGILPDQGAGGISDEERRKLCLLGYLTEGCEDDE